MFKAITTSTIFRRMLAVLLPALVLLLLGARGPQSAAAYDELVRMDRYDRYFAEYTRRYFGPDFDWRIFKAQAIAESGLDPHAVSEDGAVGIMQILPETFREIAEENPDIKGGIKSPRWNIAAGIYYNRKLWELWIADRPRKERLRFMLGAYNAGRNAILEAQQIAIERKLNPYSWPSIERVLDAVLGADHRQTIYYVKKVLKIRKKIDGVGKA